MLTCIITCPTLDSLQRTLIILSLTTLCEMEWASNSIFVYKSATRMQMTCPKSQSCWGRQLDLLVPSSGHSASQHAQGLFGTPTRAQGKENMERTGHLWPCVKKTCSPPLTTKCWAYQPGESLSYSSCPHRRVYLGQIPLISKAWWIQRKGYQPS